MNFKNLSIILMSTVALGAWAQSKMKTTVAESKQKTEVHPLMYQMLNELTALQPFMVNEMKFSSLENKKEIEKRLAELSRLSSKVMSHKNLESVSYRISGSALNDHIQGAYLAFKSGNFPYARWSLSSTPFACASCHTQGVSNPSPLWSLDESELKGTPSEKAEFLFATRNFEAAEALYTQLIRQFSSTGQPTGPQHVQDLENALKKKLMIWLRVQRNPEAAQKSIEKDLENKKIPGATQEVMKLWVKQLKLLAKTASKEAKLVGEDLLKLARKKLPADSASYPANVNPDLVNYLWVSGLLYEQLNVAQSGALTPEFLYWLGVVDLGLNNEFFFSLGSTYLRDCIEKFPRSSVTARCYVEYELQARQMFTGTRGTDIPADVQQDLKKLKALAGIE